MSGIALISSLQAVYSSVKNGSKPKVKVVGLSENTGSADVATATVAGALKGALGPLFTFFGGNCEGELSDNGEDFFIDTADGSYPKDQKSDNPSGIDASETTGTCDQTAEMDNWLADVDGQTKMDLPQETKAESEAVALVDNDNDGYPVGTDCDDNNASINPGAAEICDGIDNDCDGDRNCLPQIPETCVGDEDYGPCSCFVEPKTLEDEGAIDMDPFAILNNIHDEDTFSDNTTTYRLCAADGAEVEGSDGYHCWPDQWGIGEYAQGGPLETNFGQLGKDYLENALEIAIQEGHKVQGVLSKKDQYGRQLVYLFINEQSFPCRVLREGLAWETVNFYGLGSHPILADMALKASVMYGEQNLKFLEPYKYKSQAPKCQN